MIQCSVTKLILGAGPAGLTCGIMTASCGEQAIVLEKNNLPGMKLRLGGFEEAMATCGGVALDKVNPRTIESRLVPGLFFCGVVLNIDGDTGRYNIQFALFSGFTAGESAK